MGSINAIINVPCSGTETGPGVPDPVFQSLFPTLLRGMISQTGASAGAGSWIL